MQKRSPGEPSVMRVVEGGARAQMSIPRPAHWISPTCTGRIGQGAPKREMISVPPVILPKLISFGNAS